LKVAIVGSRDYQHPQKVRDYVAKLPAATIVVTGGARGVDRVAEAAATACGLQVLIFSADWARHKKLAGFIRNSKIVDASDRVVAFWDGASHGTADTVEKARIAGKPVEVIR
jgi:hypothetical protein